MRRSVFHSVHDLVAPAQKQIAAPNKRLRPYRWTATVESIEAKAARGQDAD